MTPSAQPAVEETDLGYSRITVPLKGGTPVVKEIDTFGFYLRLLNVGEPERKANNTPAMWQLRAEWLGKECGGEVSHLTAFVLVEHLHALVELTKKNARCPGSVPSPDTTASPPSGSAGSESPPG